MNVLGGHSESTTLHEDSATWPISAGDRLSKVGIQAPQMTFCSGKCGPGPHAAQETSYMAQIFKVHGLASRHVAPLDLGNPAKDKDLTFQKGGDAIAGRMRSLPPNTRGLSWSVVADAKNYGGMQKKCANQLGSPFHSERASDERSQTPTQVDHYQVKLKIPPFGARMWSAPEVGTRGNPQFRFLTDLLCHHLKTRGCASSMPGRVLAHHGLDSLAAISMIT
ncbi:hypothetical protein BJX63DRAFT_148552 [Aspergillus granulosus]|uniref:Carrier domain-containing protein n=1 Tax=Aspergillus granulosus TaxID=176169 RepID=A0ABR4HKY2_9EURO